MSRTIHHRKPGQDRGAPKGYQGTGRDTSTLRRAMVARSDDLGTWEPIRERRTR